MKVALNTKNQNQSNQYDVPFVKSALNFTVLAQKLLSKKTIIINNYFYYYDIALRGLINSP
jgi:hypothetical protein